MTGFAGNEMGDRFHGAALITRSRCCLEEILDVQPVCHLAGSIDFGQSAHEIGKVRINRVCIKMGQETVINAADTAWMLTATALVLLMTLPALALFYGGLVQAKNILSVLVQCAAVAALCSVLWFACRLFSWPIAATATGWAIGAAFFLRRLARDAVHPGTHIPESVFVMFQMTFAVITPALIIGAYVERIRFAAVLLISALWLLIVYAPVAHWVWGGGWLAKMGVMDFAGGIVVHVTAGVSALVIAWMLAAAA